MGRYILGFFCFFCFSSLLQSRGLESDKFAFDNNHYASNCKIVKTSLGITNVNSSHGLSDNFHLTQYKLNLQDNDSTIIFSDISKETIENLALLGRVWGFLKYHHPKIAKGNYNWDDELLKLLPEFLNVINNQERDLVISKWLKTYGPVSVCKTCKTTPNNAVLKPNLDWIENLNLSPDLQSQIKYIYTNRNQGVNYYVKLDPKVGNPDFTNENAYATISFPDKDLRLIALYRYWNMIEYFFPNKHLIDKKWESILIDYIPKFIQAKDELEYELTALQLIGEINDTHANLWSGGDKIAKLRGKFFAPFKADFIEDKYSVTDYFNPEYSKNTELKIGDIITHINGKNIDSIIDSLRPYYPSSNSASMLRDISIDLLRSPTNSLEINYLSETKRKQLRVNLYNPETLNMYRWYKVNQDEKSFKLVDGNIGYINLANIKEKDIVEIKKSFKNTKGIILDIRNYPSAFVPFSLGSFFMLKPTSFVKFSIGNPENPGEFTFKEGPKIKSDNNKYAGKLVVLVNEHSQSQAEYTAMAFRAVNNSTIIGSTTAGADGNVSIIILPGNLKTMISGIGVYYPDGTETQKVGIIPDIIVKPTIEGIKKGIDEVLHKAIEIINESNS